MANLNFFRGQYSDYLKLKGEGKVVDTNLYFTIPDGEVNKVEGDKFSNCYCLFKGEHLLTSSKQEEEIQECLSRIQALEERVDGISSELATYKVVQLTEDEIKALDNHANIKEAYKVVSVLSVEGEDGTVVENVEQVGDTIKVYKDSSLKGVELTTGTGDLSGKTVLKFTYILADGAENAVELDVEEFLSESEFKDGLVVKDGVVSVKLGEDTETNKNFLDFEGNDGEKALAVRSIDTDKTVLQKDIVIAGLGNSGIGAGNYKNDMTISAGTDIYTILENLLCKELYPESVGHQTATAGASMAALTLSLDQSGDIEVGTLVKLTEGKTNGTSASGVKDSVVSGMTYGYSSEDNDTKESSATTITKTCSTAVADNAYTISATINQGFSADTETKVKTVPSTATGTGSAELAETELGCVCEGVNKITINATGASYSYSADAIDAVYYCSNLGKTDANKKYTGVTAVSDTTSKATKSTHKEVTGKYKYFMGGSQLQDPANLDSDAIRGLVKSDWVTKDGTTQIGTWTSPGYSVVIACPSKYKLATITDSMGNSYMSKFSKSATVSVKTGEINTNYTVYMYPLENDDKMDFKNITLSKA